MAYIFPKIIMSNNPFLYKVLTLGVLYYAKIPETYGNKIVKIKLEKVTNNLVTFQTVFISGQFSSTFVLEKTDIKIIEAV